MTPAARAVLREIGKQQNLGRAPRVRETAEVTELLNAGLIDTYQPAKGGMAYRLTIQGWMAWI